MLFRGRRLGLLRRIPRTVKLQISLDSATPDGHDEHRGRGTWDRAVAGIRTATEAGFRVRVAATLTDKDPDEERLLWALLDSFGVAPDDRVLRPLARQGAATDGIHLTEQTMLPEITVTADGIGHRPDPGPLRHHRLQASGPLKPSLRPVP